MMPGDSRSSWPRDVFADARVTNLWDERDLSGAWFGRNEVGGVGTPSTPYVWDAYFAYAAAARWVDVPTPPVAAGSSIITHAAALTDSFIPLLG